ncbi:MAG: ATP-binding protein [Candidatus Nealsonbacteria bacterium]
MSKLPQKINIPERKKIVKIDKSTEDLENSRKALMNMLEDVEEAKNRAEEEKSKTLSIVSNLFDGLIVIDKEGKIFLINKQAEKFLGLPVDELMGKTIEESKIHPLIKTLIGETEAIFRKEINIKKNLTVEISTISLMIKGTEMGTMIILHDITREKTIEAMKTEFVSLAAHQLRTPLAAIKWTIRMLLDGDLGEITLEQREMIKKTYQSNERMIILINDLLDVTRIEEGRYLYKPVSADLKSLVAFTIKPYKDELKRKNIKLEFKNSRDKIPRVLMDVEKIRLVIQNILENAIKYTLTGGKINIFLKVDKEAVEVQFQDDGVGIPKDQQKRIFTKFFRGANVIRMETEGSGLGIFISKNIIEAHEGKIWFESEEGKGTTFHFSLPIRKEFKEFLKEF